MQRLLTIAFLSFLLWGSVGELCAQAPSAIPYQAVARNNSGNLLSNQNISLRFSIREASATGAIVYQETQSVATNALGLFVVNIGQGTPVSGTFSGIDWSSGSKFTQVEMDAAGGTTYTDMGTQQMLSVPYALYANSGGTPPVAGTGIAVTGTTITNTAPDQTVQLTGGGATTVMGSYPNFTVSSTDANTTYTEGTGIDITGTTVTNTAPDQPVTLTGSGITSITGTYPNFTISSSETDPEVSSSTTNQVPKWNGTTLSDGIITDNGANIGINILSPDYRFTLKGTGNEIYSVWSEDGTQTANNFSWQIAPGSGTSTSRIGYFFGNFGSSLGFMIGNTANAPLRFGVGAGSPEMMRITTNGNIGIGTTSPAEKLDVSGKTKTTNFQMTNGAANGYLLQSDASGNASWISPSSYTNQWATSGSNIYNNNGDNVGIGTSSPAEKLEVAGRTKTTDFQMTNGSANGYVLQSDATGNASWADLNTLSLVSDTLLHVSGPSGTVEGGAAESGIFQFCFLLEDIVITESTKMTFTINATCADMSTTTITLEGESIYSGSVSGANFVNTAFSTSATSDITAASAPYTGTFASNNSLSFLYGDYTGNFQVVCGYIVSDQTNGSGFTLHNFAITFSEDVGSPEQGNLNLNENWISGDGDGEGIFVNNTGNVGIGTSSPDNRLDIEGSLAIGASYSGTSSAPADGAIIQGNVGIGTTSVTQAKLVVSGSQSSNNGGYGFLNDSGNTGTSSGTHSYSIYASNRIAAGEFNAFSDARIKNILGLSNSRADLQTLMGIEITDYKLKDQIAKGSAEYKKVIAQQVEEVYPQAVSKMTDVVPDIYQLAEIQHGYIALANTLKAGERVKLIFGERSEVLEVISADANGFNVNLSEEGKVFVYGREVSDFRTVDYEALSTLNISATQELVKMIAVQQATIADQQSTIASQNKSIESLNAVQASLLADNQRMKSDIEQIKAALQLNAQANAKLD